MENVLYYGDNLDVLRRHIAAESVDLVYLDPPFKSNQNYNVLFKEQDGSRAASQIRAFEDTWTWNQEDEAIFAELVTAGGRVADVMQAFRTFLGPCDMLAYLVMMAPRLQEMRRVMKSTGSIYLHCDPMASHYLKLLMDAVFGGKNFRNEVIWCYTRPSKVVKQFPRTHDVIFFYSKTSTYYFNIDPVRIPYDKETLARSNRGAGKKSSMGSKEVEERLNPLGKSPESWWRIPMLQGNSVERLGYPTQKPEALLERIIKASSNEGDMVLDPFCGCGTTIAAAQKLNRRWIGIDITHLAITLIKSRLKDTFCDSLQFKVLGELVSIPDAAALAASDPYQFQWWALGLVGARPVEQKKGADKGIDGKIVFQGDETGKFETVILSVKAGKTGLAHVHALRGVMEHEKAAIGVLISMQEHTSPMKTEAVTAGFYESASWGRKYPKIQLFTIAELLAGKRIDMPPIRQVSATFKKAPKASLPKAENMKLFPEDSQ